jgi:predicted GH43/DUF377 family glycosyl hydrolase
MKLKKFEGNPIISPNPKNQWEELVVCNPAAWYEDGTFYMLYRAAGNDADHLIHLGLATSKDGFNFTRMSDEPVLSPTPHGYDEGCIEDPRLTKMGNLFYLTYAYRSFAPGQYWLPDEQKKKTCWLPLDDYCPNGLRWNLSHTALAVSENLKDWKKLGRITQYDLDNRDVILFPEKINGKYVRLERPMEMVGPEYGCDVPSIWINYSHNLMEWEQPKLLATGAFDWECKKLGGSTPPLRTKDGWLVIYHGVGTVDSIYRVGVMLLDLENPEKIIARSSEYIMEPEFDYENDGFYQGCVFPTGNVIVDDTLYVYYGGADRFVCVATCSVSELLEFLKGHKVEE